MLRRRSTCAAATDRQRAADAAPSQWRWPALAFAAAGVAVQPQKNPADARASAGFVEQRQ
ncbi:hypothetical protein ACFOPN_20890 [Xanthomonas hyacinthi]|uniref:hypothetical protein n=1 Tax=Xanthomonas hyacinthi TaxID=56455 RepID=UPI00361D2FA6